MTLFHDVTSAWLGMELIEIIPLSLFPLKRVLRLRKHGFTFQFTIALKRIYSIYHVMSNHSWGVYVRAMWDPLYYILATKSKSEKLTEDNKIAAWVSYKSGLRWAS